MSNDTVPERLNGLWGDSRYESVLYFDMDLGYAINLIALPVGRHKLYHLCDIADLRPKDEFVMEYRPLRQKGEEWFVAHYRFLGDMMQWCNHCGGSFFAERITLEELPEPASVKLELGKRRFLEEYGQGRE